MAFPQFFKQDYLTTTLLTQDVRAHQPRFLCPALILLTYYVCFQSVLAGDELGKLRVGEGASLADQVALTIGQ